MPPPKWLVQRWNENPNWVKRYIEGSFELNSLLCGIPIDKSATIWKPSAIKQFLEHMNTIKQVAKKPFVLYRGTTVPSPTMSSLAYEIVSCQFMSTTKSHAIAKEFKGKNGFIHELHIQKDVKYYDLENIYGDDPVKREKEVILYPGCTLHLVSFKNNKFVWNVS